MDSILPKKPPSLIPAPPAATLPPTRVEHREQDGRAIADASATRRAIFDNVLQAASTLPPIQNTRHTLELSGVQYVDPDRYDLKSQKMAILGNKTLGRRLQGTWRLKDNATGQVVDERTQTLARVPFMTDRGTFIHNGTEYSIGNQLRMRPGVFTRRKENGEIEAHANILPGEGVSHRYFLDPEKGVFYLKLQQAKIPLLPLLRTLGASDKDLHEAWGGKLFQVNAQHDDVASINKLYDRLIGPRGTETDPGARRLAIAEAMRKMKVEPEVMKRTLGKDYSNLDLPAILDVTKKLLAVSHGEQDVDDRDHLAFQTIHGPEDLFSERIAKDYGGLRRNLLWKSSFKGNLKPIPPGALTRQLESVIIGSGLGLALEETNPSELLDKLSRITKMGEGGLGSVDAIPSESRSVQPSHFSFLDPVRTPESLRTGIDLYLSAALRKGKDGRVYAPFTDPKTNQTVYRSPQDLADLTVAFPGEMNREGKRVGAMRGGKLGFFPKKEVDLVLPKFEHAFSPLAHFIPMKSAIKAQRMAMGSRMSTQAVGLTSPEAPLVQTGVPGSQGQESFEERYGSHLGALKAEKAGTILKVSPDSLTVKYADGERAEVPLYNNFVLNRKSFLHHTPLLQPGQNFQAGQLLAKSNFTDAKGASALGLNVRVGFLPFRGKNFEDAWVISEGLAKRMGSEHAYQHTLDLDDNLKTKRKDFISLFPSKFDQKTLANIDEDGVIKPGTPVNFGDPLILTARQRTDAYNKIHKPGSPAYSDHSQLWEHHSPGVVTDVFKDNRGINVVVKSTSTLQVGDKLSGRYGNKGVIAEITPDHQMPHGEDGKPLELLVNPLGVITRGNPAQVVETVLGKIAALTGKPYKIEDFDSIPDLVEFAQQEAKKHGVKDLETVTDPETGRGIKNVLVGNQYFMKLSHMAEDKLQGRAFGSYSQDEAPAKGGPEGSKHVGLLESNSILSHGAHSVIRDSSVIRGQRNEDYWLAFMQGQTPPQPRVPFVYQKFINQLRGSGIHVVEDGTKTHIMAMTNKDVDELAGDREIKNGDTVDFVKGMKPVPGGLFDPKLVGEDGGRWSYIKLHEPLPNPVMEDPIRRMLNLTKPQFEEILSGRAKLPDGGTGPAGIQQALAKIDLNRAIGQARADIVSGRKGKRDDAVRRLGFLKSAQKVGIRPEDWMLSKVPVLPAKFRPVSVMSGTGQPLVADANYLYKELIEANDNLRQMRGQVDDVGDERVALYHSFKAVTGLGDPVHPKLQEKRVRGLLAHVFGHSPKGGSVQRRLIGSSVDLVGRGVVTPNPDLDMDQIGVPENQAWQVYRPFVVRRLRRRGLPLTEALRHTSDRTSLAKDELLKEMDARPVIMNRAPVWHKFGVMAFKPRLVKGDTLHISPLVVKGLGMDFDGDAAQLHVPVEADAVDEALEKMLPSHNLISPADFKTPMHQPSQEYTGGLYASSTQKSKRPERTFVSLQDAVDAFQRGDLDLGDRVKLLS